MLDSKIDCPHCDVDMPITGIEDDFAQLECQQCICTIEVTAAEIPGGQAAFDEAALVLDPKGLERRRGFRRRESRPVAAPAVSRGRSVNTPQSHKGEAA